MHGPEPSDVSALRALMRGRAPARDDAGIPPLDSDQVLDLQRTAGNKLTSQALARWVGEENVAQALLAGLFSDPGPHAAIAAALDGLQPSIALHVTGPREHVTLDVLGPRGGAAFQVTPPATVELSFSALFGPAAALAPNEALKLAIARHTLELPLPFTAPAGAGGYVARAELRS